MDIFVSRGPTGTIISELEDVNELEEQLQSIRALDTFTDKSEVRVEITATWAEIKKLLWQPCFNNIWFDPKVLEKRKDGV